MPDFMIPPLTVKFGGSGPGLCKPPGENCIVLEDEIELKFGLLCSGGSYAGDRAAMPCSLMHNCVLKPH